MYTAAAPYSRGVCRDCGYPNGGGGEKDRKERQAPFDRVNDKCITASLVAIDRD